MSTTTGIVQIEQQRMGGAAFRDIQYIFGSFRIYYSLYFLPAFLAAVRKRVICFFQP